MKKQIGRIATKFDTDKNQHGYISFYQNKLPDNVDKLLEIGAFKGESLLMWQCIYPYAKIHAIDNFANPLCTPRAELEKWGFTVHEGDQNNLDFLRTISDAYDVIIDDGEHHPWSQILDFRCLFANNMNAKGLYFIEDVYSDEDFWNPGVEMKDRLLPAVKSFMETGKWGSKFFPEHENDFWRGVIKKIEIYDNKLILIRKK